MPRAHDGCRTASSAVTVSIPRPLHPVNGADGGLRLLAARGYVGKRMQVVS